MDQLAGKLARWQQFRVVVVGDFMLDQLVYGDAERLTNDAPVPVLKVRNTEERAGGAAHVCSALAALGGRVQAFGVVGDDVEARVLAGELEEHGVDASGLVRDPDRPTTVKRSLIGLAQHRHPQKMFRVDHESDEPMAAQHRDEMLRAVEKAIAEADIVAIEDYDKGTCDSLVCGAVIEMARRAGKEVIIDPSAAGFVEKYRGATAITPNRSEAERATGLKTGEDPLGASTVAVAEKLIGRADCTAVVMTLDRHGALLAERGSRAVHVGTRAREVYDVTGAGDMVLAALVAARANGLDWNESTRFANAAAGLEVEVFGVEPIPFDRVRWSVMSEHLDVLDKRRSLDEAEVEVRAARREGRRIVFTNGCFDVLHAGHVKLLREARKLGEFLIVAINSDASVGRLKGEGRPVHAEDDRCELLSELASVDLVVVFEEDTPERLLEVIRPDVLVKGGDYTKEGVIGGEFVESYGGEVVLVPTLEGRSTTGAIEKLRAGAGTEH